MRITLEANGKTLECTLSDSIDLEDQIVAALTWLELSILQAHGKSATELVRRWLDTPQHTHGFGVDDQ